MSNTFFTPLCGGRVTTWMSAVQVVICCAVAWPILADSNASYLAIWFAAVLSGIGGGVFSSSMANISPFFPVALQGLGLGLNAGIGNLGVAVIQLVSPQIDSVQVFGGAGVAGFWIQNTPALILITSCLSIILAFLVLNDMPSFTAGSFVAIGRYWLLQSIGWAVSFAWAALYIFLAKSDLNSIAWVCLILVITVASAVSSLVDGGASPQNHDFHSLEVEAQTS